MNYNYKNLNYLIPKINSLVELNCNFVASNVYATIFYYYNDCYYRCNILDKLLSFFDNLIPVYVINKSINSNNYIDEDIIMSTINTKLLECYTTEDITSYKSYNNIIFSIFINNETDFIYIKNIINANDNGTNFFIFIIYDDPEDTQYIYPLNNYYVLNTKNNNHMSAFLESLLFIYLNFQIEMSTNKFKYIYKLYSHENEAIKINSVSLECTNISYPMIKYDYLDSTIVNNIITFYKTNADKIIIKNIETLGKITDINNQIDRTTKEWLNASKMTKLTFSPSGIFFLPVSKLNINILNLIDFIDTDDLIDNYNTQRVISAINKYFYLIF